MHSCMYIYASFNNLATSSYTTDFYRGAVARVLLGVVGWILSTNTLAHKRYCAM